MLEYFNKQNTEVVNYLVYEYIVNEENKLLATVLKYEAVKSELREEDFEGLTFVTYTEETPIFRANLPIQQADGTWKLRTVL